MLGRAHSLSGAAAWLGGTAAYTYFTPAAQPIEPAILIMGTVITAGAALLPDLDSYTATVTKSFGVFGRIYYHAANTISILVYNLTKTRKDDDISNGHRTFFHTIVASVLIGLGVYALTSLPGKTEFMGNSISTGQLAAIVLMAFFTHLGIAGLFAPQLKKAKKNFGLFAPYIIMAVSVVFTYFVAQALPTGSADSYQWLAFVVSGGAIVHIFGDTITRMGTPFAWPLKIRGKRWYDISLPSAFRITAGGAFELTILTPLFIAVIIAGIVVHILLITQVLV